MLESLTHPDQNQVDSQNKIFMGRVLELQIVKLSLLTRCAEKSQTWHMFLINCTKAAQFP